MSSSEHVRTPLLGLRRLRDRRAARGAARSDRHETPVRVIEPRQSGPLERAQEAWAYRRLLTFFGKRLVEKLYQRTWLGWLWIPLRPGLTVAATVFLFGGVLKVGSEGVPYVIFFLVGTSVWQLFAQSTFWATRSLELNRRYLRYIYVPRLLVLVSSLSIAVVFFSMYLIMVFLAIGYYAIAKGKLYLELDPGLALAAGGLALAIAMALAIGLFTSVYGAQARDVRFILRYVLGFWYFVTPVLYPLSQMPKGYRTVGELNPMTAPIQMVKKGVLGVGEVPMISLGVTFGVLAIVGTLGLWFFIKSEAVALDSL